MSSARSEGRRPAVSVLGLLLAAVLGVGLLGVATPAEAHNVLISTAPTARQTVAATPSEVVLTFDQPAVAMGSQLIVTGPSGPVQLGAPRLVDTTVSQQLQGGSPAGDYTVDWRVTSADGHPVSGTFTFTSRAAGAGTPTPTDLPTASAAPEGDTPVTTRIVLVALFGLLLACAVAVVVPRVRRRARR